MDTIPTVPIVNPGLLYVNGLNLTYLGPKTIQISKGKCRNFANTNDIILDAPIVIDGSRNGVNGLDTGVLDITESYGVYMIASNDGSKPAAGILSIGTSLPVMPTGYDIVRRIGWVSTDNTRNILKFYHYGTGTTRDYYYDAAQTVVIVSGTATTFTNRAFSPLIPYIPTEMVCRVSYTQTSVANYVHFNPAGGTSLLGMVQFGCGSLALQHDQITLPTQLDSSGFSSILYRVGTGDNVSVVVSGYKDYLL